jgi:hypothetical protein
MTKARVWNGRALIETREDEKMRRWEDAMGRRGGVESDKMERMM